jgi:hypothetical protein
MHVRGLALPQLLNELLTDDRWRHPGEQALREIMPWFEDPLHFLTNVEEIRRESQHRFHGHRLALITPYGEGEQGVIPVTIERLAERGVCVITSVGKEGRHFGDYVRGNRRRVGGAAKVGSSDPVWI